jgi:CheY-like chemotaxis protein
VVEDNKGDVFLIREAIQGKLDAEIRIVQDGEQAIRFFEQAERDHTISCPDLVILDINLPKKHGGQVLSYMKKTIRSVGIPVVIVTSSDSARDREQMKSQGADAYFRKPSEYTEFMKLGQLVEKLLESQAGTAAGG